MISSNSIVAGLTVFIALFGCRPEPASRAPAVAPKATPSITPSEYQFVDFPDHYDWLTGIPGDLGYTLLATVRPLQPEPEWRESPAKDPVPVKCSRVLRLLKSDAAVDCAVGPDGGAWFVETRGTTSEDGLFTGVWRAGYAKGARVRYGRDEQFSVDGGHFSVNVPPMVVRFVDVTGDGTAEAAMVGYEMVNTADVSERTLTIYRIAEKALERVAPSDDRAAFGLQDCTGDGLPELYYDPYRAPGERGGVTFTFNNRRSSTAWSLLAEGTRTGFRLDGPLVEGYARALCAGLGTAPLEGRDPGTWPRVVHCRRLAGATSSELETELNHACVNVSGPVGEYCARNEKRFKAMATTPLPVSITGDGARTSAACLLRPAGN